MGALLSGCPVTKTRRAGARCTRGQRRRRDGDGKTAATGHGGQRPGMARRKGGSLHMWHDPRTQCGVGGGGARGGSGDDGTAAAGRQRRGTAEGDRAWRGGRGTHCICGMIHGPSAGLGGWRGAPGDAAVTPLLVGVLRGRGSPDQCARPSSVVTPAIGGTAPAVRGRAVPMPTALEAAGTLVQGLVRNMTVSRDRGL